MKYVKVHSKTYSKHARSARKHRPACFTHSPKRREVSQALAAVEMPRRLGLAHTPARTRLRARLGAVRGRVVAAEAPGVHVAARALEVRGQVLAEDAAAHAHADHAGVRALVTAWGPML